MSEHTIYLSDEAFDALLEDLENPSPPNEKLVEAFKRHKARFEMHADGVKEVACDFCEESCGNDWCHTKDKE